MEKNRIKTELSKIEESLEIIIEEMITKALDRKFKEITQNIDKGSPDIHFTLKEAARYLGISDATLYKWNAQRIITFFKPEGRIYYLKKDLDAFIRDKRYKVTSDDEIRSQVLTEVYTNKKFRRFR